MKQRPILFSTPMVQAILEGRKTMTRRIVKANVPVGNWNETMKKCPYGQVGDILWVRENYYQYGKWVNNGMTKTGKRKRKFVPIEEEILFSDSEEHGGEIFHLEMGDRSTSIPGWFKRLGRFMPKKYARIYLRTTNLHIERLQDISKEDAIKEGIINRTPLGYTATGLYQSETAKEAFNYLWESINGPGSWEENKWVWVVNFERIDKPE